MRMVFYRRGFGASVFDFSDAYGVANAGGILVIGMTLGVAGIGACRYVGVWPWQLQYSPRRVLRNPRRLRR